MPKEGRHMSAPRKRNDARGGWVVKALLVLGAALAVGAFGARTLLAGGGATMPKTLASCMKGPTAYATSVADEAGSVYEGWFEGADGSWRYFDPETHQMHTGWLDVDGQRFYLDDETGLLCTGWREIEGARYLFSDGSAGTVGALVTNQWFEDGDKTYHISESGALDVGWADIDGQRHYFDADGAMVTGWVHDGGKSYWIKPEDGMLANHEWIEIDGVYQAFDDDGSWVTYGDVIPPNDAENLDNMSERQWAVINACDETPWPGKALCAGWVSDVFVNAGEGPVYGDACDLANSWCVSDDLSELKPGMIIAVTSHPRTENGKIWGHVCIYIGNGLIRDSGTYGIRKSSLGSWLAWFGASETPKWGWANGENLEG